VGFGVVGLAGFVVGEEGLVVRGFAVLHVEGWSEVGGHAVRVLGVRGGCDGGEAAAGVFAGGVGAPSVPISVAVAVL
jgi:hypothetical protein